MFRYRGILFEELRSSCCANCHDGWVGDSPLVRNCIETLDDTIHDSNRPRMILARYLCLDDRWNCKQTGTGLAECFQERAVLEFADDSRPKLILGEPVIQLPP